MRISEKKAIHFLICKIGLLMLVSMLIISSSNIHSNLVFAQGGATYYVSVTGDDQNPGSKSAPWRTIQKAADTLEPGDTVYVRSGVYAEFVSLQNSGSSSGGFITFQNYPNETPVIDGTELSVSKKNQALVNLSNVNDVKFDGFEIRNLTSSSSSIDPAGIRVHNGGSNIQLLNNNIHDIKNTSAKGDGHGIHVLGNTSSPLTDLVISGNEVHHLMTGRSESVTLSGNIDGFSITNNKVYENNNIGIELAGFYGACSGSCDDQTRNGVVAENTVYRIDSSKNPAYGTGVHAAGGIYADGAKNVLIERNHVYSNDFGIELASEQNKKATSNITVQNNFIHHNYGAGLIMGGAGSSNGGAFDNTIVNNTFLENDILNQGYGEITLQWYNEDNIIANNIIYSNKQGVFVTKINTSGSDNKLDYNLLYNTNGASSKTWRWQGKSYSNWNAYKKATGLDANSLFSNPLFVDKTNNNINLTSKSPAINKGSNQYATEGADDYSGGTRIRGARVDIGAIEYIPGKVPQPTQTIQIDGLGDDWDSYSVLSTGKADATQLKATIEQSNLFVFVQGKNLLKKNQFFINSDNNSNTGFRASYWNSSGADYLLENGSLYRYSGKGGSDWSWSLVKDKNTDNYANADTIIELAIPLADLETSKNTSIKIGFIGNDSSKNKLPASSEMVTVKKSSNP